MAQSAVAATSQRLALIIGNSKYSNLGQLDNTINDARGIEKSLKEIGFKTRIVTDADESSMRKAIKSFATESIGSSISLVFYAGHGAQINGENYLLPVDMEVPKSESDVLLSGLKVDDVVNVLKSRTKVIFLDACRDNPALLKSLTKGRGSFRGGLAAAKSSSYESSNSLFIAYATDSGSIAQDGAGQKNSPFTTALLKYIKQPVSIDDMFSFVTREVRLATKNTQRPYKYASLDGLVCLTEKCGGIYSNKEDKGEQIVVESNEEIDYKVASNATDPSIILNYIDKYPNNNKVKDLYLRISELNWGWGDTWVHFEYIQSKKAPIYISPSSIKDIAGRRIFETKWVIEDESTIKGLAKGYFYHIFSYVVDCEKKSFYMYQINAYDKRNSKILDQQYADPRFVALDPLPDDPFDIINISANHACNPETLRPVVLKNELLESKWERLYTVSENVEYYLYPKTSKSNSEFKEVIVKFFFKDPKRLSLTTLGLDDKLFVPISEGYLNVPVIKSIVIKDLFNCIKETFAVIQESHFDEKDNYVGARFFNIKNIDGSEVPKTGRLRDLMNRICKV